MDSVQHRALFTNALPKHQTKHLEKSEGDFMKPCNDHTKLLRYQRYVNNTTLSQYD